MSTLQPVLVMQPDFTPAILATQKDAQDQLAAIQTLPQPDTKITTVTVSLVAPVVDQGVNLGTLIRMETVVVKALIGAAATLKFGAITEASIPLVQGEVRNNLNVSALYLNSPGGAGGTITLELQGR